MHFFSRSLSGRPASARMSNVPSGARSRKSKRGSPSGCQALRANSIQFRFR